MEIEGLQIIALGTVAFIAGATLLGATLQPERVDLRGSLGFGLALAGIGVALRGLHGDGFIEVLLFRDAKGVGAAYIVGLGIALGAALRLLIVQASTGRTRK